MKLIFAAISFLTRLPIPRSFVFEARDVGKSTIFFPLVGAIIGAIQICFLLFFGDSINTSIIKSTICAALLIVINVFVTGALHLDGLADMADGFGGGRDKERTLEIMRDSLIGSYGAVALILLILLKTLALSALIQSGAAWKMLIIAPVLARWATVPLGKFTPYARKSGGLGQSITDFVGAKELVGATLFVVFTTFSLIDWRDALKFWLIVVIITVFVARICLKKIGGVTGDTMGANTEICETAILLTAIFVR